MRNNKLSCESLCGAKSISRVGFIFTYGCLLFCFSSIYIGLEFSSRSRSEIVAVCLLPALVFVSCQHIYMSRIPLAYFSNSYYIRSLFTFLFLLSAPFCIVYRFKYPSLVHSIVSIAILGLLLEFILLFSNKIHGQFSIITDFMLHAKFIMWDCSWSNHNVSANSITWSRRNNYTNKDYITIFQDTITCQDNNEHHIFEHVTKLLKNSRVKMLDIGGGDGLFTKNLLIKTDTYNYIDELVMIDPSPWKETYINTLSTIISNQKIRVVNMGFESFDETRLYNFVLASHSLYSSYDTSMEQDKSRLTLKLLSLIENKGAVLIALASSSGMSFLFKKDALKFLYGRDIDDLCGECFKKTIPSKLEFQEIKQDDIINLTPFLEEYNSGNNTKLKSWLSYFLRSDISQLSSEGFDNLVTLLESYTINFESLPEDQIRYFPSLGGDRIHLTRSSKILMHKVVFFLISKP